LRSSETGQITPCGADDQLHRKKPARRSSYGSSL